MFRLYASSIFLFLLITCLLSACSRRSSGGYSSSSAPLYSSPSSSTTPTSATSSAPASNPGPTQTKATQLAFTRPALVVYRGQYFTYAMPADWQVAESGNGIDMNSRDQRIGATAEMLKGSPGSTTPWAFVYNTLAAVGCSNINGLSRIDWPSRESVYPGLYWQIQEFDLTYTDQRGIQRHADFTAAICNGYGAFDALVQGFATVPEIFDQAKTWMPVVVSSVNAIDASRVAYQNQLIPVQNHPLDNTGLMESWREKRLSEDHIAKAQREGMMGYERMVSPSTGRYYNMPLETYDGTVAGYRNPDHPEEILNPTEPGN